MLITAIETRGRVCHKAEVGDLVHALSICRRCSKPMELGDVFPPSGYYQRKVEIWSLRGLKGGDDTRASAKATEDSVRDRVIRLETYDLVPVFEDPVYQRSERVAARKVQLATRTAPLSL